MKTQLLKNGDLKLIAERGDLEFIRENEYEYPTFDEVIEPLLDNSEYDFIYPEEVGALTSASMLGIARRDDMGELQMVYNMWWFPDYAVRLEVEELDVHGEIIFKNAMNRDGTDYPLTQITNEDLNALLFMILPYPKYTYKNPLHWDGLRYGEDEKDQKPQKVTIELHNKYTFTLYFINEDHVNLWIRYRQDESFMYKDVLKNKYISTVFELSLDEALQIIKFFRNKRVYRQYTEDRLRKEARHVNIWAK